MSLKQRLLNQMRSLFKQVELRSVETDKIRSTVNKSPSFPPAPWGVCLLLRAFACHLIPFSSCLLLRLHGLLCSISEAWQEPCSTQPPCWLARSTPGFSSAAGCSVAVRGSSHPLPEGSPCPRGKGARTRQLGSHFFPLIQLHPFSKIYLTQKMETNQFWYPAQLPIS